MWIYGLVLLYMFLALLLVFLYTDKYNMAGFVALAAVFVIYINIPTALIMAMSVLTIAFYGKQRGVSKKPVQKLVYSDIPDFSSIDPYRVLGVSPEINHEKIKEQYRTLAKEYHPDKGTQNDNIMKKINFAYKKIIKKTTNA